MRRLIVNADDFGLSPGVNDGILEAFRRGVLTSTTMLANMPAFEHAAGLARENPDLPVGAHLTLLWGPPVSEPDRVPSLLGPDGRFPSSAAVLARRYGLGRLRHDEVRLELGAQVGRLLDRGISPTHFDTHKHVHALPGILDDVIAVARERGIEKIRLPVEARSVGQGDGERGPRPNARGRIKREILRFLARSARRRLEAAGLRSTDHFVGLAQMDDLSAPTLCFLIRRLAPGTTELMCHPGREDEGARAYGGRPPHRLRELEALTDPRVRDALAAAQVELASWGQV